MLTSIFTSYLTSDPNGTRTHDLCRDRATSYSSRLWGRIKHISLARTHMPDASADCAFLPQLSQSLNDTQTFSAVFIISVPHSTRVRVQLPSSLSHFSFFLSSHKLPKTSLLFVTLHVSITLYEVCRVFFCLRNGWPSIVLQVGFEPTLHRS